MVQKKNDERQNKACQKDKEKNDKVVVVGLPIERKD